MLFLAAGERQRRCDAGAQDEVPRSRPRAGRVVAKACSGPRRSATMNALVFIIGAVVIVGIAITLGLKFFNTSVKDEEEQKGWKD